MASTKFINECKNGANSNRLGKISVETIKKVSGTKLELSNTLDKKISPRLKGYTKQNVYSGKNNFNVEDITVSNLTTIVDKNISSFKYTNHWASELMNDINIKKTLEPSTDYIVSAKVTLISKPDVSELTGGNHGNIMILYKVGETTKAMLATSLDEKNNWKVGETKELSMPFTTPADLTGWKILTYTYLTSNYGVGEFEIDYMMIRKQGENDTFEPYVGGKASPSPDYPQEIEVGKGKNLLSEKTETTTNTYFYKDNGFEVKAGTTYTLSCDTTATGLYVRKQDNTALFTAYSKTTLTFTPTEDTLVWFDFYYTNDKSTKYQLEKGSVTTSYLPYNTIESKSTGKNLLNITEDLSTYLPITKDGLTLSLNQNSTFHLSGTKNVSGWTTFDFHFKKLVLKKGITYYSTMVLITRTASGNWLGNFTGVITPTEDYVITSGYFQFNQVKEYNEDLIAMVILGSEKPTTFEPYKESSIQYHLGDNFLADKDYIQDGVLNKNITKVVLDGSEGWAINQTTTNHISFYLASAPYRDMVEGKSNLFGDIKTWIGEVDSKSIEAIWNHNKGTSFGIKILKSRLTTQDVVGFKQWLSENPVTIYYELATPEQIQLETTGELKTYEYNTIITNDANIKTEVEYSSWDTEITNSDNLTDVSVEDSCYVDGQIIGTTFKKKATSQLIAVPNDVDLIDKRIKVEIGAKYDDLSNEMVKMGNYTIERPKDEQTENFTQITAYDDFNSLDNPYVCNLDFSKDVTIADFYIDVCNQLELTPMKTTFLNSDIKVTANPFVNKETLRVVLQEIEKVSCTFSEIDYETNKIDLVWLSENEEPDYEFATSDYTTLEGGKITYGPVNCLVIKESQIEGENTVRQDDESISANGETQIAIQDSYFLFTQALREQAIDNIWNRVKGLTYVDCKLITSYGKPFLKVGKKIRVNVNDGRVFDTYVLKHTFKYDGAFESTIESPALTKQETKVKSKSISESIRLTEIRVDKAEGNIKATTKKTQEIMDNLNNNYYSKTNVNELIQNAETGVTNTFSEAGGNNVFRNTGLWFINTGQDAETNPYEFWEGKANEGDNAKATNYKSIKLAKGSFIQDAEVPNGKYSISFFYKKLISNVIASVIINDKEYSLDSLDEKQFYTGEQDSETGEYIVDPIEVTNNHIKIEFKCDALDGVEVYDLMCNKGSVKLAYSQNQNETTTNTVNISKGITITASLEENTKLKADYDGIRILDGANNPKTKFTDKGAETDELIVRKKATITGLLHQEVDDQTWVTKI